MSRPTGGGFAIFFFSPKMIWVEGYSHTVLSSSSGSKSSSLPGSGVLVWAPARLALLLLVWQGVPGGDGWSGMNRATINATTTVQAPRRNGGPGIIVFYAKQARKKSILEEVI